MKQGLHAVATRIVGLVGLALLALGLSGCPRQPNVPTPLSGTPCTQLSDCNGGTTCGALKLCVDGYCESGTSLLRPCRSAGRPVVPPGP